MLPVLPGEHVSFKKDLKNMISEISDLTDADACKRILATTAEKKKSLFKKDVAEVAADAVAEKMDDGVLYKQLMAYLKEICAKYNHKINTDGKRSV